MANSRDSAIAQDEAEKAAYIEARLQEEKRAAANLEDGNAGSEEPEEFSDDSDTETQEAALVDKKTTAQKSQSEQLKEAGVDELKKIAWRQLKKRFWLWLGGVLAATSETWLPILIGTLIIGMVFGVTYYYWNSHTYDPKQWYYFFTLQPEKMIINALENTANDLYSGSNQSNDSEEIKKSANTGSSLSGTASAASEEFPQLVAP